MLHLKTDDERLLLNIGGTAPNEDEYGFRTATVLETKLTAQRTHPRFNPPHGDTVTHEGMVARWSTTQGHTAQTTETGHPNQHDDRSQHPGNGLRTESYTKERKHARLRPKGG